MLILLHSVQPGLRRRKELEVLDGVGVGLLSTVGVGVNLFRLRRSKLDHFLLDSP